MRKDNPIDKPITVSLFGTAASATHGSFYQ